MREAAIQRWMCRDVIVRLRIAKLRGHCFACGSARSHSVVNFYVFYGLWALLMCTIFWRKLQITDFRRIIIVCFFMILRLYNRYRWTLCKCKELGI
jgi:hypothetical protein